jgi:hypothetical protein
MELRDRLTALARIETAPTPVVSVYLSTRWADEQQRERARIFLKGELRRAREAGGLRADATDLDWVESEGESVIGQARFPDAHGVAFFACQGLALREVLAVRAAFENRLVVAATPFLLPLAAALDDTPAAVVVFVDAERARLVPLDLAGAGSEVVLEADLPGRGDWARVAEARYQRHLQDHRHRHFDAVAESLVALVEDGGVEQIVLAGEPRNLGALRQSLPTRIAAKVVGTVEGARHEPASAIVTRAAELIDHTQRQRRAESIDAVLTEAAKSRQAVAGLGETLEAVNRGAVQRLYITKSFNPPGCACSGCGALAHGPSSACRLCGKPTSAVELAQAMTDRVLATGGRVAVTDEHQRLARVDGVAALLRYPL